MACSMWCLLAFAACTDGTAAPDGAAAVQRQLQLVGGDAQIASAGNELEAPLVAQVTNGRGAPVPGVPASWQVSSGVITASESVTDGSGLVRATWVLGAGVGRVDATVAAANHTVSFHATAVEPLVPGRTRPLRLTTFEGSGQLVHPDVARVPRGWAQARRFLAVTPYPGGDVANELPSIYQSGDPTEWAAPDGLTNPIVRPRKGYLSDPDLVFEPVRRELWMYYRHVQRANTILLTTSIDGTRWSPSEVIIAAPNHQIVSPAIVRVGPGDWHMWSVNAGGSGCRADTTFVEHRTSADGRHWSAPEPVRMSAEGALPPWHIDVVWVPDQREFWALYNEKPAGSCTTEALRLSTSPDGITWTLHPTPVLSAGVIPEFRTIVYRSTIEYDARSDMVTLWYSGARTGDGETWRWSAAVERRSRADLFRVVDAPTFARRTRRPPVFPLLDAP